MTSIRYMSGLLLAVGSFMCTPVEPSQQTDESTLIGEEPGVVDSEPNDGEAPGHPVPELPDPPSVDPADPPPAADEGSHDDGDNVDDEPIDEPPNTPPQSPAIELLDCSLSVTSARDGQTVQAGYHLSGPPGTEVRLVCRLISPDNTPGADGGESLVTLDSQAGWYYRDFWINAPPPASAAVHDVEWEVRWGDGSVTSSRKPAYLTTTEPLPVRAPILMYHSLGPVAHSPYWVTTEQFAGQMRALKAYGYTTISFYDLMEYRAGEASPPAKPVILTFDDGDAGVYNHAWPILADPSIDFSATAFLITDLMGHSDPPDVILTWDQVEELHQSGRFDIQSHTVSHAYLSQLTGLPLVNELAGARSQIEVRLDKPVHFLSWPYGDLNGEAKRVAWSSGYRAAVGIGSGVEADSSDKWVLRRVFVDCHTTLEYSPLHPDDFFLTRIGDPDILIPQIGLETIEALNPETQQTWGDNPVPAGGQIRFVAAATNEGPAVPIRALLTLSHEASSPDEPDGHAADVTLEVLQEFSAGTAQFEWLWTVPNDVAAGRYQARVSFHDAHDVVTWFRSSPDQNVSVMVGTGQGPTINVWYGDTQKFGRWGMPQPMVNILGNVSSPEGVVSISCSLNGGPSRTLSMGPNTMRLAELGDFNIDLSFDELLPDSNELVIRAVDTIGRQSERTVNVIDSSGPAWPLPYTITWAGAGRINDVAQVTDGLWAIEETGVRSLVMAYDRLIAIGDVTWQDYEVATTITVHAIDPNGYAAPSYGPGVGIAVRWPGHSDDGSQPQQGVYPLGGIGMFRWTREYERFEMFGNEGRIMEWDASGEQLQLGVTYLLKMGVQDTASDAEYRLKWWRSDQPEPSTPQLVCTQSFHDDPGCGSVLLLAHHVDATFGDVSIVPLP